jgi:hypothetical protein
MVMNAPISAIPISLGCRMPHFCFKSTKNRAKFKSYLLFFEGVVKVTNALAHLVKQAVRSKGGAATFSDLLRLYMCTVFKGKPMM